MASPKGATEVGSKLYLFKSGTNSRDCIISAHGGYVFENRAFTVPEGVYLHFYGEHGAALIDPNIGSFMRNVGDAVPVEVVEPGKTCRNYLLSKYQGAHAGASGSEVVETYDQIGAVVKVQDANRAKTFNTIIRNITTKDPDTKLVQMSWETLDRARGGSVLTVRNRWHILFGVPLKDAIAAAKKAMPTLKDFHCVFCRSNMLGNDPKAAQDVRFKSR